MKDKNSEQLKKLGQTAFFIYSETEMINWNLNLNKFIFGRWFNAGSKYDRQPHYKC